MHHGLGANKCFGAGKVEDGSRKLFLKPPHQGIFLSTPNKKTAPHQGLIPPPPRWRLPGQGRGVGSVAGEGSLG